MHYYLSALLRTAMASVVALELCLSTAALLVVHLQYGIRDNQSNANNLQLVVVVVVLQEGEGKVQDGWRQSKVYYVHARDTYYR